MKKVLAMLLAVKMVAGLSVTAFADDAGFEEIPIWEDEEVAFLNVSAVYFQPVPMAPDQEDIEGFDLHLECDVSAMENNLGYELGSWVPYMTIDFEVINEETEETADDTTVEETEETAFDEDALAGVYGDAEPEEYDVETPVGAMECINDRLEAGLETAEEVENSRIAAIYDALSEMPYGEGSMFDFFTKPYAEVSGENISALYPLVSTLSAGQVAAIEFLPLSTLLRIGVMNGEAFEAIDSDNSDIMEIFDSIDAVSVYYNVNREIFKDCTALTSEALRKNAGGTFSFTEPITELGGLSALTTLFWAADAVALALCHARSSTSLLNRGGDSPCSTT